MWPPAGHVFGRVESKTQKFPKQKRKIKRACFCSTADLLHCNCYGFHVHSDGCCKGCDVLVHASNWMMLPMGSWWFILNVTSRRGVQGAAGSYETAKTTMLLCPVAGHELLTLVSRPTSESSLDQRADTLGRKIVLMHCPSDNVNTI